MRFVSAKKGGINTKVPLINQKQKFCKVPKQKAP